MDLRAKAASLTLDDIVALLEKELTLTRQLDWFRRQVFGALSERRILSALPAAEQLWLGKQMLEPSENPPEPGVSVGGYERQQRMNPVKFSDTDSRLQFDETVPVEVIHVPNPEVDGLASDEFEYISERVTHRLAQRSSYVVLKYIQPVVKLKDTGKLTCPPVPRAVFERSMVDVSFLAGMVIDKFQHHLPLYRQHQRLEQAGIGIHRSTLTRLVHRTGEVLEPIYDALLTSVLQSSVLTVDESPTPAGINPGKPGHMRTAYFWALYGDNREVAFLFSPSRARKVLDAALGSFEGTLLTDGYAAYDSYVRDLRKGELTHAHCWVHTRRYFIEAERFKPQHTAQVLLWMQKLFQLEEEVAGPDLERRLRFRQEFAKPIVDELFAYFKKQVESSALLPSDPFLRAMSYALAREKQLRVFLHEPAVPMDTNHVERTLRPPAVGRKNWMFHVTEIGARYAAMFYSLIETCKLHGVHPTVYLTDILQRQDTHPSQDVHLLTPRLWVEHFRDNPLLSDVNRKR